MKIYLNIKELSDYLGICPRAVKTLIKNKKVIPIDVKGITRYILVNDIFIYLSQ